MKKFLALMCMLSLVDVSALRIVPRLAAPGLDDAGSLVRRLGRGAAALSLAVAVQCQGSQLSLADAPLKSGLETDSYSIAVAAVKQDFESRDLALQQKLKSLSELINELSTAKKVSISELTFAEKQERDVSRLVKEKSTDPIKRKLLQAELNNNIRKAISTKKAEVAQIKTSIAKDVLDLAATKENIVKNSQRLKENLRKVGVDNEAAAQSQYKSEVRVVSDVEKRLAACKVELAAVQTSIAGELQKDKELLSSIAKKEKEAESLRRKEQSVVASVETKTKNAASIIRKGEEIEVGLKSEKARLDMLRQNLRKAQSLAR